MTETEMVLRYRPIAYYQASRLRIPGAEREDVRQEALAALVVGWRCYRPDMGRLESHLHRVVRRRLIDMLDHALRPGRLLLVEAGRDPELAPARCDLEQQVEARAELHDTLDRLAAISPAMRRAVIGVAIGFSYTELGPFKQVDNAVQRGRRKLREAA